MKQRRSHLSAANRSESGAPSALDILALLNLAPVVGRDLHDRIIHWGHGAQGLYGFSSEEALGQVSHQLLRTRFVLPLPELQAQLLARDYWKGELIHTRKDGSQLIVLSEWVLQRTAQGHACAVLEVNQDITEQKRTAENLRTIFNNVNDGIILHAADGTVLEVNQRFLTLYGLEMRPESKLSIVDLSSPSAPVDSLPEIWAKVMAGENQRFQWKARRPKDGSEFEVEVFLTKIRLRQADAILATVRDITRRKHAEEQLRLQSAALQSAANAIVITGRDGLIQWVNPAFTRSTGYSAQEVIGRNPRLLKSGTHPVGFYRVLWQTILSGQVWHGEVVNKRKDGSRYTEEMTITPVQDATGTITHFIAIKQDVTQRKQAQQALLRQNQKLSVLNAAAEALLSATDSHAALEAVYDRIAEYFQVDGFIEFQLNPAGDMLELVACKTVAGARHPSITRLALGQGISGKVAQTRQPIVLANAQHSTDPDLQFVRELGACAYACEPLVVGERLLGTLSFASCRRPSFDPEDQEFFRTLANYIALAKERLRLTTELQQHAANLEQTVQERTAQLVEANTNLQTFTHTAAHDLRSPLRTIKNFSSLAIEELGAQLGAEGLDYLRRMSQSADQMSNLLNDLLEYSKLSQAELRPEPVPLDHAVDEALSLLQEEIRSQGAEVTVQRPLPVVSGHPTTVTLVIANFLSNALKFMAPGVPPRIRIWAEPQSGIAGFMDKGISGAADPGRAAIGHSSANPPTHQPTNPPTHQPTPTVRLCVQDNGIGIAPEGQAKLFQPFQRLQSKSSYSGTGLGLAIVRRAVERMGGQVGLTSQPGQGSCFWAELRPAP